MICPKCNNRNTNDAKFCSHCGMNLSPNTCWSCEKPIVQGDIFCIHCGKKQNASDISTVLIKLSKFKAIISLLLWAIAIVTTILAIKNEAEYGELLLYSIITTILATGGLLVSKNQWFKRIESVCYIIMGTGTFLFLHGIFSYYISSFSRRYRYWYWEDIELNFWVGLVIVLIGLGLLIFAKKSFKLKPDVESDSTRKDYTNQTNAKVDATFESDNASGQQPKTTGDRIYWDTVINGMTFRLAWLISYIGLPIGLTLTLGLLFATHSVSLLTLILLVNFFITFLTFIGLYRFKRYSYISLMISYWLNLITSIITFFIFIPFVDARNIFGMLISVCITIPFIYYFYKRKNVFYR